MEITTKFNLGDTVWTVDLMHLNIRSFEVARIGVTSTIENGTNVELYPSDGKGGYEWKCYEEKKCYPRKEDLMDQLNGE